MKTKIIVYTEQIRGEKGQLRGLKWQLVEITPKYANDGDNFDYTCQLSYFFIIAKQKEPQLVIKTYQIEQL